jgi:hypothetical protein
MRTTCMLLYMYTLYLQESIKADPAKAESYQLVDVREPNELMLAAIRSPAFLNLPLSQSNVRYHLTPCCIKFEAATVFVLDV